MTLTQAFSEIREQIPEHVTLVAVSKTKPNALIEEAYAIGERHFGENRVQELCDKAEALPKDILWHQIGHLQTNKIKYIVPFVHLIHAVDSEKVLKEINKQGEKISRVINCLLQVKIAEEDSKFGWDDTSLTEALSSDLLSRFPYVSIHGLMGMATFTDNTDQVRSEFRSLKATFDHTQKNHSSEKHPWNTLSMGMSGDFKIAIEEGSTMVRIGSSLFGGRG